MCLRNLLHEEDIPYSHLFGLGLAPPAQWCCLVSVTNEQGSVTNEEAIDKLIHIHRWIWQSKTTRRRSGEGSPTRHIIPCRRRRSCCSEWLRRRSCSEWRSCCSDWRSCCTWCTPRSTLQQCKLTTTITATTN